MTNNFRRAAPALAAPVQPRRARAGGPAGGAGERAGTRLPRGDLPLSYTGATKPRPRIKLAANLPVGIELRGEVVEAYFDELRANRSDRGRRGAVPRGDRVPRRERGLARVPVGRLAAARRREYEVKVKGDDSLTSDALRGAVVRPPAPRSDREATPRRERAPERCRRSRPSAVHRGRRDSRRRREEAHCAPDRPPARCHRRREARGCRPGARPAAAGGALHSNAPPVR